MSYHMIIQGSVGMEDLQLAVHLNLPLYSAEPDPIAVFSSQSGSKRIFTAACIAHATGAHDIYDEDDLVTQLARLMVYHSDVMRWIVKIDDERGGRGIAYLDTGGLKVSGTCDQTWSMNEDVGSTCHVFTCSCHVI